MLRAHAEHAPGTSAAPDPIAAVAAAAPAVAPTGFRPAVAHARPARVQDAPRVPHDVSRCFCGTLDHSLAAGRELLRQHTHAYACPNAPASILPCLARSVSASFVSSISGNMERRCSIGLASGLSSSASLSPRRSTLDSPIVAPGAARSVRCVARAMDYVSRLETVCATWQGWSGDFVRPLFRCQDTQGPWLRLCTWCTTQRQVVDLPHDCLRRWCGPY